MTPPRAIAAAMAMAALGACALSPAPTRDVVLGEALPQGTEIPTQWRADAQKAAVANDWLRSLDDPALERLVAEAVANNLDLRQAAERVAVAQQAVVVVGSRLLPQLGINLGARTTVDEGNSGSFDTTQAFAGVAWELDLWGRLRAQRAAAEAAYEATALDYAYGLQSLAATVAKVWYLASEARQLLALAERSVKIYQEQLGLARMRRAAGKEADLDVADARAKVATAQAEALAARQDYEVILRALEVLLGRYPAADVEAARAFPTLPPPVDAGAPIDLLDRRPDIVAAERVVLARFRQEEAANLALLPSVSISLVGGRLGDQALSVLTLNPWLASAAVGISIPIYDGGRLRAKIDIADAQQAEAVAAYGAAVLGAFKEVEDALASERLLMRRLPFADSAVRDRTEAVRIATLQYVEGRRDLLWVSALQSAQLASQAALIKLRGLQRLNRIQLYLALGGSFDATPAVTAVQAPPTRRPRSLD